MSAKMFLMGLKSYFASYKNVFDATITVVGLVSQRADFRAPVHPTRSPFPVQIASVLSEFNLVGNKFVRVIMILRSLRLLRLFSRMKKFRMIFATLVQLIPIFTALLGISTNLLGVCLSAWLRRLVHYPGVLVFQYYFFGLIGIRLFGGLLNTQNPILQTTTYAAVHYYPNNFNDFGSACVVLFDLMVINNWYD